MEAAFTKVGIDSAEALRDMGTDAAYARLLDGGAKPHFIPFYVIEMALQGRPWNDCSGDEKAALRVRFDRVKADHAAPPRSELEDFLDRIGVCASGGTG